MRFVLVLIFSIFLISCDKEKTSSNSEIKFIKENPKILQPDEYKMDSKAVLIRGAKIMTATGTTFEKANLLMKDGVIQEVSEQDIEVSKDTEVIQGAGLTITPGLIDVHSHMGVYPSPSVDAHMDGNEMVKAVTADVWAEHSFWPQDPDLWRAMAGGITTIQVLPGSGNLFGGRSFVAKLIPEISAREMRFPGAKQGLKMACGENPKRVYKGKELMTRMGNVAGYRRTFQTALEYAREWEKYNKGKSKEGKIPKRDLVSETLVKVLKGEIFIHFHCYRADDISAILDVAQEFGFKIRTIHHGLEAYKIANRLAKEDVAIATWADWWGFKAEAYDGIPYNAALLENAGAKPIIHSDSSVDVRYLNVEAGKALSSAKKMGLNITEEQALAWVTKNAAWALGLDDKIGTIEKGKMADVVVWDRHPFSVYAKAQYVFINGKKSFDRPNKQRIRSDFEVGVMDMAFHDGRKFSIPPEIQNISWSDKSLELEQLVNKSFVIVNVKAFIAGMWVEGAKVEVRNGKISSISSGPATPDLPTINGEGKFLTPGFIEAQSDLAIYDIELDSKAQDLYSGTDLPTPDYKAADALNTNNSRIANRRQEGVLTSIAVVNGAVASSMGVAFDLVKDQIVDSEVALFGKVVKGGHKGKKSRSAIWSELRQFLDDANLYLKNPTAFNNGSSRPTNVTSRHLAAMKPILLGEKPWVVRAERSADIKNLVKLKNRHPKLKLIIYGGAEAWTESALLKKHKIPVILIPSYQTPSNFDKLQARFDQAAYLVNEGVEIIIADSGGYGFGRTRQEAGLAVKYGLSPEAALSAISETPGKVFGMDRGSIKLKSPANIVMWNADPLEPTSWAERIWVSGEEQPNFNRHRALADKYLKAQVK